MIEGQKLLNAWKESQKVDDIKNYLQEQEVIDKINDDIEQEKKDIKKYTHTQMANYLIDLFNSFVELVNYSSEGFIDIADVTSRYYIVLFIHQITLHLHSLNINILDQKVLNVIQKKKCFKLVQILSLLNYSKEEADYE